MERIPTAHRRPKFRLEEMTRSEMLKLAVATIGGIIFLSIIWVIQKEDIDNAPIDVPVSLDCPVTAPPPTEPPTPAPTPAPADPPAGGNYRLAAIAEDASSSSGGSGSGSGSGSDSSSGSGSGSSSGSSSGSGSGSDSSSAGGSSGSKGASPVQLSVRFDEMIKNGCRLRASLGGVGFGDSDATPVRWNMVFTVNETIAKTMAVQFYKVGVQDISLITRGPVSHRKGFETSIRCPWNDKHCYLGQEVLIQISDDISQMQGISFKLSVENTNPCTKDMLGDVSISATTTSRSFEKRQMLFRYMLLIVASVAFVAFYYKIGFGKLKYPWVAWALEQKWTAILLGLLICLNNPFCVKTFMANGGDRQFWIVFDSALSYTFLCGYLLAVLAMTDHMAQTKRKTTREFYLPKVTLLGAIWVVMVFTVMSTPLAQDRMKNPLVVAFLSVMISVYLIWLFFLIALMIHKARSSNTGTSLHISLRFKLVWGLNVIMIAAITAALYRISVWGLRSTEFLFGYAGFNAYVLVLAALFAPAATSMPYRPPPPATQDQEIVINDEYEVEGDY